MAAILYQGWANFPHEGPRWKKIWNRGSHWLEEQSEKDHHDRRKKSSRPQKDQNNNNNELRFLKKVGLNRNFNSIAQIYRKQKLCLFFLLGGSIKSLTTKTLISEIPVAWFCSFFFEIWASMEGHLIKVFTFMHKVSVTHRDLKTPEIGVGGFRNIVWCGNFCEHF